MLFNSLEFLLFGAVFFSGWRFFRKGRNRRWIYLCACSFLFYGWWDWRFLFLILGSGFIDYFASLAMERWAGWRKVFLVLSLLGNVGSLATFKYLDFLISNANSLVSLFGADWQVPAAGLTLPVGISFYTFQSMSYTIDVYRGKLKPTRNVFHFFAYLSMFPQLVAGPIVRAADLLPQLEKVPSTNESQQWSGLRLIVFGYFKKVVVADTVATYVTAAISADIPASSGAYWWVIMVLFSLQIYCDFSGYSDIARGLAHWMGYEFPLNFDHPYNSTSIREFWSRWHISLSTWFRDYVYFPLGGTRKGYARGHLNMWITMLVSGLWHGAGWTFVIWGGLHAFYLSLERVTNWPARIRSFRFGRLVALGIVFFLVLIAWVFFISKSFQQAVQILAIMFNPALLRFDVVAAVFPKKVAILASLMLIRHLYLFLGMDSWQIRTGIWITRLEPVFLGGLMAMCVFLRGPGTAFIYFQF